MMSCLDLERPGRWRSLTLGTLVALLLMPSAPLLVQGLSAADVSLGPFATALVTSIVIALSTAAITLAIGLPGGVATALYDYRSRLALLALALVPALVPSFLLSIGWSYAAPGTSGVLPCVIVFSTTLAPLVLLAAYAAARSLPRSVIETARIAGGDRVLLGAALRHAAPAALLVAGFAGVLTLSDPGPGQVFGVRTAAAELLVSFAANYDFAVAARQCLMLSAVVLAVSAPLVWHSAPRLTAAFSSRLQASASPRTAGRWAWFSALPLAALSAGLAVPVFGLLMPLAPGRLTAVATQPHPEAVTWWAFSEVMRTLVGTVLYATGAAAVSILVALLWALAVGRSPRRILVSIALLLPLMALPPAASALGLAQLVAHLPAWADVLSRGPHLVCTALGLRLAPIAILLVMRAYAATPRSWTLAAALHGISLKQFSMNVLLPALLPALALSGLTIALLSNVDVTTVLILHPPGLASLPLAIFTVMANAPEYLVASLCLAYVGIAAAALTALWALAARVEHG